MSRLVKIDNASKERTLLSRMIIHSLRELMTMTNLDDNARDHAAFIIFALRELFSTVETSVAAWEKRGYWLKADKFRLEWEWALITSNKIEQSLINGDWGSLAVLLAGVGGKLKNVKLPVRYKPGEPWKGAWAKLNEKTPLG